jgi:hypothetical protein
MNDIIVLSEPRTGSNLMCEMFYRYKEFRVLNEFFIDVDSNDPHIVPHVTALSLKEKEKFLKKFNIENNDAGKLVKEIIRSPVAAYDFLNQLIPDYKVIKCHRSMLKPLNIEFLLDKNNNFVFISRSDILAQYVSRAVAMKINKWHNVDTSHEKISIDINDLLNYRDMYNQGLEYKTQLAKNNKNILDINYEQDIDTDNKILAEKVNNWLKFLDITVTETEYVPNFFKKQNHSPMQEIIVNYDEVLTALSKY